MSKVEVEKAPPEPPAEERDWAKLHGDVLMVIFRKIGIYQVILCTSKVCRSWRKAARDDPLLWRRIDMTMNRTDLHQIYSFKGKKREAVLASGRRVAAEIRKLAINWGGNSVQQMWIGSCCDGNLLEYIAERARNLKSLSITTSTMFMIETMAKALGRLKQLEELEILCCIAASGLIMKVIGTECPQLKRLKVKSTVFYGQTEERVEIWLGIPKTLMLQLKCLQLDTIITNEELMKILEKCPNLEVLDLRGSNRVTVKDHDIRARCTRIHTLLFPRKMPSQARNPI